VGDRSIITHPFLAIGQARWHALNTSEPITSRTKRDEGINDPISRFISVLPAELLSVGFPTATQFWHA
jgi:hypothetical protein